MTVPGEEDYKRLASTNNNKNNANNNNNNQYPDSFPAASALIDVENEAHIASQMNHKNVPVKKSLQINDFSKLARFAETRREGFLAFVKYYQNEN